MEIIMQRIGRIRIFFLFTVTVFILFPFPFIPFPGSHPGTILPPTSL